MLLARHAAALLEARLPVVAQRRDGLAPLPVPMPSVGVAEFARVLELAQPPPGLRVRLLVLALASRAA